MKTIIHFFAIAAQFCLLITISYSQPVIEWQKCLGGSSEDEATSIQQTSDGGYIVAGYTDSNNGDVTGNHGSYDYWIVKFDTVGFIQWKKCLGGSWDEFASSIQQTSDGGYIVAGSSSSNDGDVTGNHGDGDYWVVKLTALGIIQWQKCLGGSGGDWAHSIQQTSDGGYIVAGSTDSNDGDITGNHGDGDYWVVKLTSSGIIQWQKCLGGSGIEGSCSVIRGGTSSIQQTSDGGYILAGSTSSDDGDVTGNHGSPYFDYGCDCYLYPYDYWVVKLNSAGQIQWQKCLGGTDDDIATSIQQTSDGGYIVAGYSNSNDGDITGNHGGSDDYWVVKLDSLGTLKWQKCLGGSSWDVATSIRQTNDGGYIVAGFANSNDGDVTGNHGEADYWVVKFDILGNIQWQKCLGGSMVEWAYSIQVTSDSGYIVAGIAYSNNGDLPINKVGSFWVVKLSNYSIPSIAATNIKAIINPICSGISTNLSVIGGLLGTGANWKWYSVSCGGTLAGTGSSITVSPTSTTNYYVRAEGSCNTTACASVTITVTPSVAASVSIAASPSATICTGKRDTLTATAINGGSAPHYQWKRDGITLSGKTNSTLISSGFANNDIITCVMTSNATCVTGSPATSNAITMVVNTPSTVPTSISATNNPMCYGSSTNLTLTGGTLGTGASWKWYSGKCGGTFVGTGAAITVSPTSTTKYYVRAEGYCNTTSCVSITITVLSPTLTTTNIGFDKATLNWSGFCSNPVNYKVAYTNNTTLATQYAYTTGANITVNLLSPNTKYSWKVSPNYGSGYIYYSLPVTFTTITPPAMYASPVQFNQATLHWQPYPGAVNYAIKYYKTATPTVFTIKYSTVNTLTITGLTLGTGYSWQVNPNYGSGYTTYSAAASFTTPVPVLTADTVNFNRAVLDWKGIPGTVKYAVKYYDSSNPSVFHAGYSTSDSITLTTWLIAGTNYSWQVLPDYGGGYTSYTPAATFTTTPPVLTTTSVTTSQATLNWTNILGAKRYAIKYYKTATPASYIVKYSTGNSLPITGLTSSTQYSWNVNPDYGSGYTTWSPATTFTTGTKKLVNPELISSEEPGGLFIYPNPANEVLSIKYKVNSTNSEGQYVVYNVMGQMLLTGSLAKQEFQINISSLAKGVYLLKVEDEEGVAVRKFIKE